MDRRGGPEIGDVLLDGGRGTRRAGIGEEEPARDIGIGDAVFERGRGIDNAGRGDAGWGCV